MASVTYGKCIMANVIMAKIFMAKILWQMKLSRWWTVRKIRTDDDEQSEKLGQVMMNSQKN